MNAKSADDKEWQLQRQLQHAETGPALLRPIGAYNEFASRFSGAIFTPSACSGNRTFRWEKA